MYVALFTHCEAPKTVCVAAKARRSGELSWISSRIRVELWTSLMVFLIVFIVFSGSSNQIFSASISFERMFFEGMDSM